ncbi:MAG: glycosyltransferase family 2 protein, partial [Deltaproteobacteria bacterium]|nr:glycosyltransferase family 2 protein [Deltaproteobacteria bacterium]
MGHRASGAKVFVVILNWNGLKDTLECLESIQKTDYPNVDVIVVDNGSADGSPKAIREAFPGVTLLETGQNLGYADGNNVGIRYALKHGADHVFLLNNDTTVHPEVLTHLVAAAKIAQPVAIFGSKIHYYDRPEIIWSAGVQITWDHICWKRTPCLPFRHLGMDELDRGQYAAIATVDSVVGCALFVRANLFEQIGLLDGRYFLLHEESDFCLRARKKGYLVAVVPESIVWHKVCGSFKREPPSLHTYYNVRNSLLFISRYAP